MGKGKRPKQPKPPATAFRQPIRVRIVAACTEEEVCPADFAEREGMRKEKASRYFRELADECYLRISKREPSRGSTRYYYSAIRQAMIADAEFGTLVPHSQHGFTVMTLRDLLQRYGKAWRADTLTLRGVDLFHSELCLLDLKRFEELMQLLEGAMQRILSLEAEAKVRARREGAQLTQSTVALAGFVSPPDNHPEEGPEVFFDFFRRSYVAFMSGWLDARDDSHLTWIPLELDEQGWKEFAAELRELRQRAEEIKARATKGLWRSGRKGIPTQFAFAGFQSPPKNPAEPERLSLAA